MFLHLHQEGNNHIVIINADDICEIRDHLKDSAAILKRDGTWLAVSESIYELIELMQENKIIAGVCLSKGEF